MTEGEWLACRDLELMLRALDPRKHDRKLRLFACACCRRIWHLLEESSRRVVEVSERYADSAASYEELRAAVSACVGTGTNASARWAVDGAAAAHAASYRASAESYYRAALYAAGACGEATDPSRSHSPTRQARELAEAGAQRILLRDIVGNPFRPPQALNPAWLAGDGAAISVLARVIYDERRWEDLPILADALEEAGCTNADMLNHCRQPGEHIRGCWVVDLLLGKS